LATELLIFVYRYWACEGTFVATIVEEFAERAMIEEVWAI